jgi:hypothetical protein
MRGAEVDCVELRENVLFETLFDLLQVVVLVHSALRVEKKKNEESGEDR